MKNFDARKLALILLLAAIAAALGGVATWYYVSSATPQTTQVGNIFVDLNGDGAPDLLVSGQAIFNSAGESPVKNASLP